MAEKRPSLGPPRRLGDAARREALRRRRFIAASLGALLLIGGLAAAIALVATRGDSGASPDQATSASPRRSPSPSPTALPTPTQQKPLKLFSGGDSMGGDLANSLAPLLSETGLVKAVVVYKVSSGLVRPDFFDWLAFLRKYSYRYKAMVFMAGTNDAQGLRVGDRVYLFGTKGWKKEYRRRVGSAMDTMLKERVQRVYWVGMPIMRAPAFRKDMAIINAAFVDEAAKRPQVTYIDTWSFFATADGAYDPRWRQDDGVHFTISGVRRLANYVADFIKRDWHIR